MSQLSRECERRTNKRLILSDLRDSGNIEQAGDKCIICLQDEYYYADTDKPGIAEVIVAKNKRWSHRDRRVGMGGRISDIYEPYKKGGRL